MEKREVGDWIKIVSFKHDGSFHRSWDKTCLLSENDDFLIFVNSHAEIKESDGRNWMAKDPAVSIFYKKKFFNIICMIRATGIYYYCNVASPYVFDEGVLKYIDYDLDISFSAKKPVKILDENEYQDNRKKLKYSDKLDVICRNALSQLYELVTNQQFPFIDEKIYRLYDEYCLLNNYINRKKTI